MIKIANRQIFIFFFNFLKKNMGPSNIGNWIGLFDYTEACTKIWKLWSFILFHLDKDEMTESVSNHQGRCFSFGVAG